MNRIHAFCILLSRRDNSHNWANTERCPTLSSHTNFNLIEGNVHLAKRTIIYLWLICNFII